MVFEEYIVEFTDAPKFTTEKKWRDNFDENAIYKSNRKSTQTKFIQPPLNLVKTPIVRITPRRKTAIRRYHNAEET